MDEKTTKDVKAEDFGMGDEPQTQSAQAPKINNYMNDVKSPAQPTTQKPQVDPKGNPPPVTTSPAQQPQTSQSSQSASQTPASSTQGKTIGQIKTGKTLPPPMDPAKRKKVVLGCLGGFGSIMLIFLAIAFLFISQSDETTTNPIAKLLNLNQAGFINGLITFIHLIFIVVSLTVFVFTMVGIFKASMAKKDDKDAKRSGLKMSLISGIILMMVFLVWGFVYFYLDGKRINVQTADIAPIVTEPEDTLNLTAPVDIRFDASNVPVDQRKFQIISYDWNFGDKSTGTSQIVSHTFEEKGRYDVILKVTKIDKKTGEETIDSYTVIVSIQNEALSAIIEADPQSGPAPLKVKLDAGKSEDPDGTIKTYEWDLDEDGEFDDATGKTVEKEFTKIGKYKVSLRVVSSTEEFDVAEKEIIVEQAKLPEAKIEIADNPTAFTTGVEYIFKSASTSPGGSIEKYEWDFGDGSKPQTTKTVSHAFTKEGTFDVTLKVVDEKEEEAEILMTITVGSPQGTPKAKIQTDPVSVDGTVNLEGEVPFTIAFDATGSTDSDNNIVDYAWDFDDDGKDDKFGAKATYTYALEGTYTARLKVIDADENIGAASLIIKVKSQGIKAHLQADKTDGSIPLTVEFDASGSSYQNGQITSYQWDFGDGGKPKVGSAKINHKYTEIGTYTASVVAIGSDNSRSTAQIIITVREIPLAACFVSVFEEGKAPLKTSFDPGCTTGTAVKYLWDFGDGQSSTEVSPMHTYEQAGAYTATLEITDADNTVSSASLKITVTAE